MPGYWQQNRLRFVRTWHIGMLLEQLDILIALFPVKYLMFSVYNFVHQFHAGGPQIPSGMFFPMLFCKSLKHIARSDSIQHGAYGFAVHKCQIG